MTTDAEVETPIQSNSTAFLFKSLKRLYIYAQFIGCACFSYSYSYGRVHVTCLNLLTFVFFTGFYMVLAYLNLILQKTIDATGYQAILFFIGEYLIPSHGLCIMWILICLLYLIRKKIAQMMLDLMILDNEVREHTQRILIVYICVCVSLTKNSTAEF